jgi:hypothetical protein
VSKAIQVSVRTLHGNVLGLMAGFAIERAVCGMSGLGQVRKSGPLSDLVR